MKNLRIIIIEDSENDYFLIERVLRQSNIDFTGTRVDNKEELMQQFKQNRYDIVLSDNSLPGMDAFTALEVTRSMQHDVPFIIVSGAIGEERAVDAMKAGANDYISKNNLSRLPLALKREAREAENRRMRMESEKDLMTFIYRSSHDLKGPLASIKGILSIMKSSVSPEDIMDNLSFLEQSTCHLEIALQRLLHIFRVKESTVDCEQVLIPQILDEVILSVKLYDNHEQVDFRNYTLLETIHTDAYLLKAILQNVIENAVRYRDESKRCVIEIHTYASFDSVTFVIKDNGAGIKKELHDKVFDIFFRGNAASKGNGLGLYISKRAVEKMNGSISMSSVEGKGTIVKVRLPLTTVVKP